ncbi:hypothetical protein RRG08_008189 [Elysia crispata]|uniref:Uncharacterized protein n=1 Tax=Elysia crispata TaxID=231223 RepID=A0AAE1A786_9GAST|nr:hypothetical protein RRG08_008189 [Elysia crispata]
MPESLGKSEKDKGNIRSTYGAQGVLMAVEATGYFAAIILHHPRTVLGRLYKITWPDVTLPLLSPVRVFLVVEITDQRRLARQNDSPNGRSRYISCLSNIRQVEASLDWRQG